MASHRYLPNEVAPLIRNGWRLRLRMPGVADKLGAQGSPTSRPKPTLSADASATRRGTGTALVTAQQYVLYSLLQYSGACQAFVPNTHALLILFPAPTVGTPWRSLLSSPSRTSNWPPLLPYSFPASLTAMDGQSIRLGMPFFFKRVNSDRLNRQQTRF